MRHLLTLIMIIAAIATAMVSCDKNNDPQPPNQGGINDSIPNGNDTIINGNDTIIPDDGNDTITPTNPTDSIPTEYTGWENMQRDTILKGAMGASHVYIPTVTIYDEDGNNLLDVNNPDNVREDNFYCLYNNMIYNKGSKLPFLSTVEIGYRIPIPYGSEYAYPPFLVLGETLSTVDKEFMFYWPEKNYRMHIRAYCVSEEVYIPEYAERYPESNGIGIVTSYGTFYNGKLNASKLILHKDGTVTGPKLN